MPTVDDTLAASVTALLPRALDRGGEDAFARALAWLAEAERLRRGVPEPVTGALHVTALTQGELLRREYDLSVHAHGGWPLGAIVLDVLGTIHVNMAAGFPAGDRLLRTVAEALAATFPGAPVVRIHGDCFAVLLVPSADTELVPAHVTTARAAMRDAAAGLRAEVPALPVGLDATVTGLSLRVHDPSHWQVLGPLVWGELERTHVVGRRGDAGEARIVARTLRLDGRV